MIALLQFDAVSLPIVERLLAEDRLPTLAALKRRGTWVPIEAVAAAQPAMRKILDFQAIQDADRDLLSGIFEALVDPPARPRVERVDQIALTPGGKIRTLISRAARPSAATNASGH